MITIKIVIGASISFEKEGDDRGHLLLYESMEVKKHT